METQRKLLIKLQEDVMEKVIKWGVFTSKEFCQFAKMVYNTNDESSLLLTLTLIEIGIKNK